MGDLSGLRIVVPETRELGQLVRMLEERGADTVPCPMIAIRDAPRPSHSGNRLGIVTDEVSQEQ